MEKINNNYTCIYMIDTNNEQNENKKKYNNNKILECASLIIRNMRSENDLHRGWLRIRVSTRHNSPRKWPANDSPRRVSQQSSLVAKAARPVDTQEFEQERLDNVATSLTRG